MPAPPIMRRSTWVLRRTNSSRRRRPWPSASTTTPPTWPRNPVPMPSWPGPRPGWARPGPDPEQDAGEHPSAARRRAVASPAAAAGAEPAPAATCAGSSTADARAGHAGTLASVLSAPPSAGLQTCPASTRPVRLSRPLTREASHERLDHSFCGRSCWRCRCCRRQHTPRQDDMDISRLNSSLDQLANDPAWAATPRRSRRVPATRSTSWPRPARHDRAHALYLAERRVDLAKRRGTAAGRAAEDQPARSRARPDPARNSRREAEMARRELERQRLQYQMAQEEAARLQQQGRGVLRRPPPRRRPRRCRPRSWRPRRAKVASAATTQAALAAQAARGDACADAGRAARQPTPAAPEKSRASKARALEASSPKADRLTLAAFVASVAGHRAAACCDVSFKIRNVFVERRKTLF